MTRPVVCEAGSAVVDINDSAFDKAVFLNQGLHDEIVGVGVKAHVAGEGFCIVCGALEKPVRLSVAG